MGASRGNGLGGGGNALTVSVSTTVSEGSNSFKEISEEVHEVMRSCCGRTVQR